MRENALNHRRLFNHGNELQFAAARAMLNVDLEHALQQPRPCHAHRCAVRMLAIPVVCGRRLRRRRHNLGSQLRVRRQHPVKAYQVQPWARHQWAKYGVGHDINVTICFYLVIVVKKDLPTPAIGGVVVSATAKAAAYFSMCARNPISRFLLGSGGAIN